MKISSQEDKDSISFNVNIAVDETVSIGPSRCSEWSVSVTG